MSNARVPDPIQVFQEFVDRVRPYDPDPHTAPVATVEIRADRSRAAGGIALTPHLAAALARALAGYRDPADRGCCAECGGRRLDDNLHCLDCGRLHGVLGEVIARRAARHRGAAHAADTGGEPV